MRKIAVAIFKYFPAGGLQKDCLSFLQSCLAQGDQVTLLTQACASILPTGIQVKIVQVQGFTNHQRAKNFSDTIQQLSRQVYDIIVGFNKMAGLDYYFAGDDCLAALLPRYKHYLPRYRHYLALERAVFATTSTTKIWTLTARQQQQFNHTYQTPAQRFTQLAPSLPLAFQVTYAVFAKRDAWRSELGLTNHDYALLIVASYFKTKGLARALQTVAALPPELQARCHLFIIGGDDPRPFLAQTTNQVHFLGEQDEVLPFYMAADVLLHPAHHEAAGQVLLEAIASGLPIVTTANCGYSYHVQAAQAGQVLDATWPIADSIKALQAIFATDRHTWYQRLQSYKMHFSFVRGYQLRQLLEPAV